MIKIRLSKLGRKNTPTFRIVAIEERRKREGKALDIIGYWYPAKNQKKINTEKLNKWLARGARKTRAVEELLSAK